MKSYLMTGGCGFIGTNFIRHTPEARPDWRILNLDALTYADNLSNFDNLPLGGCLELRSGDREHGGMVSGAHGLGAVNSNRRVSELDEGELRVAG